MFGPCGGKSPRRWDGFSENSFQLVGWIGRRHTPPLIQNFIRGFCSTFFMFHSSVFCLGSSSASVFGDTVWDESIWRTEIGRFVVVYSGRMECFHAAAVRSWPCCYHGWSGSSKASQHAACSVFNAPTFICGRGKQGTQFLIIWVNLREEYLCRFQHIFAGFG